MVFFSSSIVPGNERSVQRLKDMLYKKGADVVHYKMMDVHAGGHAKQGDLFNMIKMVKPKYHVPVYGNHSFLQIHAKVARKGSVKDSCHAFTSRLSLSSLQRTSHGIVCAPYYSFLSMFPNPSHHTNPVAF